MKAQFVLLLSAIAVIASSASATIKDRQTLLGGTVIRAGVAHTTELSDGELDSLCNEGVTKAYYLYPGANARTRSCGKGSISYRSITWTDTTPILQSINSALGNGTKVFIHCHNGAHATGYVAAIAMRQFCGFDGDQAMKYFDKTNKYGQPPAYTKIRNNLHSSLGSWWSAEAASRHHCARSRNALR